MLAVRWALENFEYESRGKRFKLESDHKALLEIRKKSYFNNRINRWIEHIQEFDCDVTYIESKKMRTAFLLSRVSEKKKKSWEKGKKIKDGKEKRLLKVEKGKVYWLFD